MGRTATATGGGLTPMWRRDDNGDLYQDEPEPNDYRTPPRGTRGRIQLTGISDKFEMPNKFSDKPDATVTKVRLEFEIVKAAGKHKDAEGILFTDLYTLSTHPKANFGKLLGTLRGREIQLGETVDYDAFISTTFIAMTRLSDDGLYAGVSPEAIEPDSIVVFGANGSKPEPALVGAGDDSAALFEGDGDDL